MPQTLDDIRTSGQADLQGLLANLDARHRAMLLDAIARYGSVRTVPESIWETIRQDVANETAAALLLIVADADDWTAERIADAGVPTGALKTSELADYSITTARQADELALVTTDTLRSRLERKVQDSMLTGPGDVGELTGDGIAQAIDDVLTTGRRATIAVDQTTAAISRGQIGARDRTVGGDGAALVGGQKVTIALIWRTHPEESATGPCTRCSPLDGKPEEVWSLVFPEGPGEEAHPNCVCTLDVQVVVSPAGDDEP